MSDLAWLASGTVVVFATVLTGRRWLMVAGCLYAAVVIAWFFAGVAGGV